MEGILKELEEWGGVDRHKILSVIPDIEINNFSQISIKVSSILKDIYE